MKTTTMNSQNIRVKQTILSAMILVFSTVAWAGRPVRGYYDVPVNDELKQFARYPVKFKSDNYADVPNVISFPMPTMLVGDQQYFTMSKVDGKENTYAGKNIEGTCQTIGRYLQCQVKFVDLAIDQEKVKAAIDGAGLPAAEAAGKQEVAFRFFSEPIGILTYTLRGNGADDDQP